MRRVFESFLGIASLRTGCIIVGVTKLAWAIFICYVAHRSNMSQPMPREWWKMWSLVGRYLQEPMRIIFLHVIGIPISLLASLALLIGVLMERDGPMLVCIISLIVQFVPICLFHFYMLYWHQFSPHFRIQLFVSIYLWTHVYILCLTSSLYSWTRDIHSRNLGRPDYMTNSFILPHRRAVAKMMEESSKGHRSTIDSRVVQVRVKESMQHSVIEEDSP